MLSHFRVAKLASAEEFDRLLNEVLMNGQTIPLAARLRLSEPGALASSALGLALKRLTEITWKPEPPAEGLADRLLQEQHPDGRFGNFASTLCALAALRALQRQVAALPGTRVGMEFLPSQLSRRIEASAERAAAWVQSICSAGQPAQRANLSDRAIATDVSESEPADRPIDALDTAMLLWQFASDPVLLCQAGIDDPESTVESLALRHDRSTATLVSAIVDHRALAASTTGAQSRTRTSRRAA